MNWELIGVGPGNSGAELMALAALEQVRKIDSEVRFCMAPAAHAPYTWRASHGMYQVWCREQSGRLAWVREKLIHVGYRKRFGIVMEGEVDVILDASGFSLGDAWEPDGVRRIADRYGRAAKNGTKVILLPQAFGPFENARMREASRRVLSSACLVFARDSESLAHARSLVGDAERLHLAPDFTNLLGSTSVGVTQHGSDDKRVAFVPNRQMISEQTGITAATYARIFAKAIDAASEAGFSPFILVHEEDDDTMSTQISDATMCGAAVVHGKSALECKRILSSCVMTVCSRYHAIISSLSLGVPCIGTSWSHKYEHLFEEYEAADLLVTDLARLPDRLREVADPSCLGKWRIHLQACGKDRLAAAKRCWQLVGEVAMDKNGEPRPGG